MLCVYILERNVPYAELGGDWFIHRDSQDRHVKKLVSQLKDLGYEVLRDSQADHAGDIVTDHVL